MSSVSQVSQSKIVCVYKEEDAVGHNYREESVANVSKNQNLSPSPRTELGEILNRSYFPTVYLSDSVGIFWSNEVITSLFPVGIHVFWKMGGREICESRGLTALWTVMSKILSATATGQFFVRRQGAWGLGNGIYREGLVPILPMDGQDAWYSLAAMVMTVRLVGALGYGRAGGSPADTVSESFERHIAQYGGHFISLEDVFVDRKGLLMDGSCVVKDLVALWDGLDDGSVRITSKTQNLPIVAHGGSDKSQVLNGSIYASYCRTMVGNWGNWSFAQTVQGALLCRYNALITSFRMYPATFESFQIPRGGLIPLEQMVYSDRVHWTGEGVQIDDPVVEVVQTK